MLTKRVEKLRTEYADQYVVVDAECPELARFKGMIGQVQTINYCGRALVQFDGNSNRAWYDVGLDYLKVVEKPEPKGQAAGKDLPPKCKSMVAEGKPAAGESTAEQPEKAVQEKPKPQKLSPLEIARMENSKKELGDSSS